MHKLWRSVTTLVLLTLGAAASAQGIGYTAASGGFVPTGSIIAGHEANGEQLFSCVTEHNGGMHPGKLRPGFGGCNIGYGGRELMGANYLVVGGQGRWTWARFPGDLPVQAVTAGHEADGTPLFVCRAAFNGGMHPGKFRSDWTGCNIGYGGREITLQSYEVLEE